RTYFRSWTVVKSDAFSIRLDAVSLRKQPNPQFGCRVSRHTASVTNAGQLGVPRLGNDACFLQRRDNITRARDRNRLILIAVESPDRDTVHLWRLLRRPDSAPWGSSGKLVGMVRGTCAFY